MRNNPKRDGPRRFIICLWTLTAALAVLTLPALGWAQDDETRIALVIGNGYGGELKNPPNDARLMATTLRGLGFTLVGDKGGQPLIDADQRAMKRAIQTFGEALDRAGPSAVGLFYYAGHGVQANGRNYLIPIGADIRREADLEIEAISTDSVLAQMEYSRSRVNLVILDACRNNPYQRRFRSMARGLAQMGAPSGSLIAYATAPGEIAEDGPGANSPYTAALAEAIAIPGLAVEQAFKLVRITVKKVTGDRQVPWDASSLTGEFSFKPAMSVAQPAPPPALPSVNTPTDIENYIKNYMAATFLRITSLNTAPRTAIPGKNMTMKATYYVIPPREGLGGFPVIPVTVTERWVFDAGIGERKAISRSIIVEPGERNTESTIPIPMNASSGGYIEFTINIQDGPSDTMDRKFTIIPRN